MLKNQGRRIIITPTREGERELTNCVRDIVK
jgi:hypothetical protein